MGEIKIIQPEELQAKIENGEILSIIDVREDYEVIHGMVPGAIQIKMGEIPERLSELNKELEHIIICHAGVRSENVAYYLQEQGYKAASMEGGMLLWKGEFVF